MKLIPHLLAVLALSAGACLTVRADPIVGTINFVGRATFDTHSLATATQVTLTNGSVAGADGTFGLFVTPFVTPVTFAPLYIFNPSTNTPMLWQADGFTYDLTSSSIADQGAEYLNVRGVGTVTGNGYDPTFGEWSFTSTSANGVNQGSFGFAASTVASSAVPDAGSTALLIGTAVMAFGVFMPRRQKLV